MMFYTTVGGWMISYIIKSAQGAFDTTAPDVVFANMLANPVEQVGWMLVTVVLGFLVCSLGLQKGVERITQSHDELFVSHHDRVVYSQRHPGWSGRRPQILSCAGFRQDVRKWLGQLWRGGVCRYGTVLLHLEFGHLLPWPFLAAYIGKERRLLGEALNIGVLDTLVALMAGLIIFPACFAFGVNPGEGPGLVFVTLPSVFNQMWGSRLWGVLFFLFMSFAALSTVIAVFENLISFCMDKWGWERKKAVIVNGIAVAILSLPCALGFNVWSSVTLPGIGDIQTIEDFIISNNILPIGSLIYLLFCLSKRGWGWENFIAEADTGRGLKFPKWSRLYLKYVLPLLILIIFIMGYLPKFQTWLGL